MKLKNKLNQISSSLLLLVFLTFTGLWYSCDNVGEDELTVPDEISTVLEFSASINATNDLPGILDLNKMRNHADFSQFDILANPENGVVSFTDDESKLIYVPNESFENGEDGFIITALNENSEVFLQNAVKVIVKPDDNDGNGSGGEPTVDVFTFAQMSTKDSILVVDLLDNDVFKDMPYQGSRAVNIIDIANIDGLNISVFSSPNRSGEEAWLTYSPPHGFTGDVEFIYELCFGWSSSGCDGGSLFDCADLSTVCNYSTSTQAKIVVTP